MGSVYVITVMVFLESVQCEEESDGLNCPWDKYTDEDLGLCLPCHDLCNPAFHPRECANKCPDYMRHLMKGSPTTETTTVLSATVDKTDPGMMNMSWLMLVMLIICCIITITLWTMCVLLVKFHRMGLYPRMRQEVMENQHDDIELDGHLTCLSNNGEVTDIVRLQEDNTGVRDSGIWTKSDKSNLTESRLDNQCNFPVTEGAVAKEFSQVGERTSWSCNSLALDHDMALQVASETHMFGNCMLVTSGNLKSEENINLLAGKRGSLDSRGSRDRKGSRSDCTVLKTATTTDGTPESRRLLPNSSQRDRSCDDICNPPGGILLSSESLEMNCPYIASERPSHISENLSGPAFSGSEPSSWTDSEPSAPQECREASNQNFPGGWLVGGVCGGGDDSVASNMPHQPESADDLVEHVAPSLDSGCVESSTRPHEGIQHLDMDVSGDFGDQLSTLSQDSASGDLPSPPVLRHAQNWMQGIDYIWGCARGRDSVLDIYVYEVSVERARQEILQHTGLLEHQFNVLLLQRPPELVPLSAKTLAEDGPINYGPESANSEEREVLLERVT